MGIIDEILNPRPPKEWVMHLVHRCDAVSGPDKRQEDGQAYYRIGDRNRNWCAAIQIESVDTIGNRIDCIGQSLIACYDFRLDDGLPIWIDPGPVEYHIDDMHCTCPWFSCLTSGVHSCGPSPISAVARSESSAQRQ